MAQRRDGSVTQSSMRFDRGDYSHQQITHPVLGVVLNVYCADDNLNAEARTFQDQRGTQCMARVLVTNDGRDVPWILPSVAITPTGGTGIDNFSEEVPSGCTGTADFGKFDWSLLDIDPATLNGDWCVVDFIGGSTAMPFIVSWWPHPSNRRDSTTGGVPTRTADPRGKNLRQGRRWVKRFQGTRFAVTSNGDVFLSTSEANTKLKPGGGRTTTEDGGEIGVTVKSSQRVVVDFNPPAPDQLGADGKVFQDHQDVLQPNPQPAQKIREETLTRLSMDKDFIQVVAGQVVRIIAKTGDIELTPAGNLFMGDTTASENMVLGQSWKSMMESLLDEIAVITVPTAFGPSGIPNNAGQFNAIKATLQTHLSDFIFGQKTAPTP